MIKKISTIILGLGLMAIGVLCFVNNGLLISIICIGVGIVIICNSVSSLINATAVKPIIECDRVAKTLMLIKNILGLLLGLFAVISPIAFSNAIEKVISYAVAIYLLYCSLVSIKIYFGLKKLKLEASRFLAEFLLELCFAAIFITVPGLISNTIFTILGIGLLVLGVLISTITILQITKQKKTKVEVVEEINPQQP